ncbi:MAG: CRISPR-associated endonuclease Cas6 [Candidatus Cloacimonadota bacterium]|nr:CRISPR-associated endonuclease Cas6 [Candidatus Cloacimonadota bacterium]
MKIKIIKIVFLSNKLLERNIPKFRGFLASEYPNYNPIHNHLNDGKFRYSYPQIQFKTIGQHPAIIGINEGISILKKVFLELDNIKIGEKIQKVNEKSIQIVEENFGIADKYIDYRFLSPWMALNQINFTKYINLDRFKQQQFLKHLLRENLKTISKGFDYTIPDIESIKVDGNFNAKNVNFKNVSMLCFEGKFMVNFHLPDFLGIGKQVARGFGTVKK